VIGASGVDVSAWKTAVLRRRFSRPAGKSSHDVSAEIFLSRDDGQSWPELSAGISSPSEQPVLR